MQTDPSNPKNSILSIPSEIMKAQGWGPGTEIKIQIGDQGTIIIEEAEKKVDKSE
jgi:antitoxin component of MazEF toxin-antitoxin module